MFVYVLEKHQSKNLFQVKMDLAAQTKLLESLFLSAFIIDHLL